MERAIESGGASGDFFIRRPTLFVCIMATLFFELPGSGDFAACEEIVSGAEFVSQADAIASTRASLERELEANGGWASWIAATREFRQDLWKYESEDATGAYTRGGKNIWIRWVSVDGRAAALKLTQESPPDIERSSTVVESITRFEKYLKSHDTDLIFVPIPDRLDIYPELYSEKSAEGVYPDPYVRAIVLDLLDADIEVLDVFDLIRDAKDGAGDEIVYYRYDDHPRSAVQSLVAREIADRLMRYSSVRDGISERAAFQQREVAGPNIFEYKIAKDDPLAYAPCPECGYTQILDGEGRLLSRVDSGPAIIAGDSFVSMPLYGVDQKWTIGLNLHSHIMGAIRMKTARIVQLGGGPKVPRMIGTSRYAALGERDVVVWIMNARFLGRAFDERWREGLWPPVD